jgi:flagellar motor component MotA
MNNQDTKNLNEMNNSELLELLWSALNKANSKGVYSIDEAYLIKLTYIKLTQNINK